MADEVILDEEAVTTVKRKYDMATNEWKVSYNVKSKRSFDLKYWIVREVEMVGFGKDKDSTTTDMLSEIGSFMNSCSYDLFSIPIFDGERKEKYDD